MAGYRFCRSDDVPRLVEAYNACYRVHFPDLPELTLDGFKRWIREIQVWSSSCMLATGDDGRPIGVLIGAKRETANRVVALGIHPDHLRQGHGAHLVTSLGRKLAILGPPRIVAELPEDLAPARACFESCGYRPERTYTDFVLADDHRLEASTHPLVAPIDAAQIAAAGLLHAGPERCWDRAPESLLARKDRLAGLALASEARIEACVLYSSGAEDATCRIEFAHAADPDRAGALVGLLLGHLLAASGRPLSFVRLADGEIPFESLRRWGFAPAGRTLASIAEVRAS